MIVTVHLTNYIYKGACCHIISCCHSRNLLCLKWEKIFVVQKSSTQWHF